MATRLADGIAHADKCDQCHQHDDELLHETQYDTVNLADERRCHTLHGERQRGSRRAGGECSQ